MPMGVATSAVRTTISTLPTIALASPPPSEPGAGVDWVNMAQSMAEKPFLNSTAKIQSSTTRPKAMAAIESVKPMRLTSLRRR